MVWIVSMLYFITSCQPGSPDVPAGFELHPDFRMELVAAEPLTFDPVALGFDEKGRTFVLEMPGYPLRDEASRLILLEDENGDGIYDRRHVYADGLGAACSFMPYRGGMLVAAPPELLWLKDTNEDNTADKRTVLMEGFTDGNLQHNVNALTYGLDNWIYAANGGNSGRPFFPKKSGEKLDLRGDDFRFRIEEKRLERVGESSGGFGLAFDNWGRLFETHNLEHVSNLVFPGYYIEGLPVEPSHTLTVISDHEENGLSRIYPIGEQETRVNHPEQSGYFSGACGITHYGGGAFPERFNGQLFVADVVLNLVHLDLLSPDGASFKASRNREKVEFLASMDRAFRPVYLTTGPDGALYLIDMHRNVIEHPEWIPDEIEATLDLKAGRDKGRVYRITPRKGWVPARPQLDINRPEGLVKALEDKNQWVRMTAQRLMVGSQDEAFIPLLEALYQRTAYPLARLHCLWALEGLGALNNSLLARAFRDTSAGVRENALKIAEIHLDSHPEWIEPILKMALDENARVRMQAALTLSTLSEEHYRPRAEAIISTLSRMLATLPADEWSAMAVAAAARKDAVAFCNRLLAEPRDSLDENQLGVALTLARLTGRQNNLGQTRELLNILHTSQVARQWEKTALIEALAYGWESSEGSKEGAPSGSSLLATLESIEQDDSPATFRATGRLRKAIGLPVSQKMSRQIKAALAVVSDRQLPVEERLALLQLIALEEFASKKQALYALLDNREPLALQKEALAQLWEANDPNVARHFVECWPTLGPEARKLAGDILLYKTYNHGLLLSALENNTIRPGELNFDLERRRVLLFSDDKLTRTRAEALFSDAGVTTRKEAIEKMRPALALPGDVEKGKAVFEKLCGTCHRYGPIGQDVGPVLTEINRKSKESLLHDILDPNAAVDTKYLNHQARTRDGNIYSGMIQREGDSEITLKMAGGPEITLKKERIEQLSSLGISLMPEGLESGMSHQDMAGLLAFLQQPSQ